jgi:hypothetical protein
MDTQHLARWRGLSGTQWQAGELISVPSPAKKTRILFFNRTHSKVVIGLLIGHNALGRHFHLTFWHRCFTFNSNKSPTWSNNFLFHYPDVCLQHNTFRAFSRPSSGAQWLQWQPLVLPSYRGDSRAVFVVGPAGPTTNNVRIINWKTVASGWWFIWIVRWCTDLQTLNFTFKF